jgi:hypothetical protein
VEDCTKLDKYTAAGLDIIFCKIVQSDWLPGTELDPGPVRLSEAAHRHMAEDHPDDYAVCITSLPQAIADPSFIGQAPKRTGNFELVRRVNRPDGKAVLVAVGLEADLSGYYRVRSCYLVTAETVDNRRRAGRLNPPPPR